MEKIYLNDEELKKIAAFIGLSSQVLKQATDLGKNLLKDNEELQARVEELENEKQAAKKEKTIEKIAGMLRDNGWVSKSDIPEKVAELRKMSDEALHQLENTFDGLNGTPAEKQAAVDGFTTLDFMASISIDESKTNDGRPGPMSFQ